MLALGDEFVEAELLVAVSAARFLTLKMGEPWAGYSVDTSVLSVSLSEVKRLKFARPAVSVTCVEVNGALKNKNLHVKLQF